MKYLLILFLALSALSSCQKEEGPLVIIEPKPARKIAADTIFSGEKWGLKIGEQAENLYGNVQGLSFAEPVSFLGVVGNVFVGLDSLEDKIPLYRSVFIDKEKGTEDGIQVNFSNNKVSSIYTNSGKSLSRWPASLPLEASVIKGDPIEGVYAKLVNIRKNAIYSSWFDRVSIIFKDTKKGYDPRMAVSKQWYFLVNADGNTFYEVFLNLKDGKLFSLSYTLYEK